MKKEFLILLILLIFFSCKNKDNTNGNNDNDTTITSTTIDSQPTIEIIHDTVYRNINLTYNQLLEKAAKYEAANYSDFIDISYTTRYKINHKIELHFKIRSLAVAEEFKDIDLQIDFISKTGSTIATETYTIYEFFDPCKEISRYYTSNKHFDVSSVDVTLLSATPSGFIRQTPTINTYYE